MGYPHEFDREDNLLMRFRPTHNTHLLCIMGQDILITENMKVKIHNWNSQLIRVEC